MLSDAAFTAGIHRLVDECNRGVEAHNGSDEYKIRIDGSVRGVGFVVGGSTVLAGGDIVAATEEKTKG